MNKTLLKPGGGGHIRGKGSANLRGGIEGSSPAGQHCCEKAAGKWGICRGRAALGRMAARGRKGLRSRYT